MTATQTERLTGVGPITGIIDSDVHPNFKDGLRDLRPYMTEAWQRKLGIGGEASWASRITDVIDAWETARQSDDPFWVAAVIKQIKRLARTSNGLMMVTHAVA